MTDCLREENGVLVQVPEGSVLIEFDYAQTFGQVNLGAWACQAPAGFFRARGISSKRLEFQGLRPVQDHLALIAGCSE